MHTIKYVNLFYKIANVMVCFENKKVIKVVYYIILYYTLLISITNSND